MVGVLVVVVDIILDYWFGVVGDWCVVLVYVFVVGFYV